MTDRSSNIVLLGCILLNGLVGLGWWAVRDRYEFADPDFFWLLLLIPLLSIWYCIGHSKRDLKVGISGLDRFGDHRSAYDYLRHLPAFLRMGGLALLIVALARPQSSQSWEERQNEGIDIVLALDVSGSMLAEDFKPNRLEGSKNVAMDFVKSRPNDRIGLVIYEAESFTQVPLTTDHRVLLDMFEEVTTGNLEGGTAVGLGLATAVSRLKESEAKSKVVILLSDGVSESGSVSPTDAAKVAEYYGVRVYTIGVGKKGYANAPVSINARGQYNYGRVKVEIDEETLKQVATQTGGRYFRATNNQKLSEIYQEIDQLEKTRINVTEYSKKAEKFFPFVLGGGAAIVLGLVFSLFVFRTLD